MVVNLHVEKNTIQHDMSCLPALLNNMISDAIAKRSLSLIWLDRPRPCQSQQRCQMNLSNLVIKFTTCRISCPPTHTSPHPPQIRNHFQWPWSKSCWYSTGTEVDHMLSFVSMHKQWKSSSILTLCFQGHSHYNNVNACWLSLLTTYILQGHPYSMMLCW